MRILLASSSQVGIQTLNHLIQSQNLIGVLTSPDKPKGRGQTLTPNELAKYAQELGITTYKPNNAKELHLLLNDLKPDLVVTVAYGRLIKKAELELPINGWLNVHFSLLPKWRGAAPVQYAIMNGDAVTGVTVFKLDEGMDTGPIYSQASYVMQGNENTHELLDRLSLLSLPVLDEAIQKISNRVAPVAQSQEDVSLAPKITKEQGRLNWSEEGAKLERKIRALNPWPGAWTEISGCRLQIFETKLVNSNLTAPPGELQISDKVLVSTGSGALELLQVKPEGKRLMQADEWARGIQNQNNLRFV